jgi:hypothetical protein
MNADARAGRATLGVPCLNRPVPKVSPATKTQRSTPRRL